MKLLLSGEGKTDMGQNVLAQQGMELRPGPMAWIVDRLLEEQLRYSLLDQHRQGGDCVHLIDEAELGRSARAARRASMRLPGIRYGRGNGYFTRNAELLGLRANQLATSSGQPVIAVLFRDGDGTRATPRDEWQKKRDSIRRGFELVECHTGVAMVPRPKSEAWLLCGMKAQPYANCVSLEDAPGNDRSPNSLKSQLIAAVGHEAYADEQSGWITSGRVDPARIDMPSFNVFREDLRHVAESVVV
ncbi:MAG: hypothetical protein Q8O52_20835 [Sulfuritalea sp.]|nr:hypothetical protein [Sulfuritalea sp.]